VKKGKNYGRFGGGDTDKTLLEGSWDYQVQYEYNLETPETVGRVGTGGKGIGY